jgi:hypothetical protein
MSRLFPKKEALAFPGAGRQEVPIGTALLGATAMGTGTRRWCSHRHGLRAAEIVDLRWFTAPDQRRRGQRSSARALVARASAPRSQAPKSPSGKFVPEPAQREGQGW